MMKVTIRDLCQSKGYSEFDILKLKKELISYKNNGKLFFTKDIVELSIDETFDLYYFQLSNDTSSVNAFPVPFDCYQSYRNNLEQYDYLKPFFENYYIGRSLDEEEFHRYDLTRPFVGNDYVWYFKRSV